MRRMFIGLAVAGITSGVTPAPARAQDGAALFTENCAPCHNIGEAGGAGPDLRGVSTRRDHAWLVRFVLDPHSVNKSSAMPTPEGLNREAIAAILAYVDQRSSGAPPETAAPPAPDPVFSPDDVARGGALFAGTARLSGGGPSCLSCHDAGQHAGLGGGTLGPNLTLVATRLRGPKGTAAWMSAPPTPVMRSIFATSPLAASEVHALTAFFLDRARPDMPGTPPQQNRFAALGVLGAFVAFGLIAAGFRGRLRPVRRALVRDAAHRHAPRATHSQGFRSGGPR